MQKGPRRPGGDSLVLCVVDLADARFAATALKKLGGYKLILTEYPKLKFSLFFSGLLRGVLIWIIDLVARLAFWSYYPFGTFSLHKPHCPFDN